MRNIFLAFLILVCTIAYAAAQNSIPNFIDINSLPVPSTGSTSLTNSGTVSGDWVPVNRGGVTYKVLAGQGGTCATNTFVSMINQQGVPTCSAPIPSNSITLGTSVSSANPHLSTDITTGFFGPAPGTIGIANGTGGQSVSIGSDDVINAGMHLENMHAPGYNPGLDGGGFFAGIELQAYNNSPAWIGVNRWSADSTAAIIAGTKNRASGVANVGNPVVLNTGDNILHITAQGYDGTTWHEASGIWFGAEGTIATSQIPGNIRFKTSNSSGTPTEAMRINSAQEVGIGTSTLGTSTILTTNGRGLFTNGLVDPNDGSQAGVAVGFNTSGNYGFVGALQTGVTSYPLVLQPQFGGAGVGIGSTTPRSALDISQATGAVILPIGTTGTEPSPPVNGMIRYNSTNTGLEAYVNNGWNPVFTQTVTVTAGPGASPQTATCAAAKTLTSGSCLDATVANACSTVVTAGLAGNVVATSSAGNVTATAVCAF